ncbi:hypothetical protein BDK51DRAFT_32381 [Blyttiomyces helicus]|uniref:Uncharacterized protein n=1 Tax=Blyttiomyces helicus TaxID=388810 RepID=A0A4P9W924_9FUNG|nr:hypothetical protein BDK51DRAFT_32381 [Blyttiomyces helicus]|eukprot:RKO87973.1 hypothetical protein BDK51DRAFT_32381 [Blyttiomyces helicus]
MTCQNPPPLAVENVRQEDTPPASLGQKPQIPVVDAAEVSQEISGRKDVGRPPRSDSVNETWQDARRVRQSLSVQRRQERHAEQKRGVAEDDLAAHVVPVGWLKWDLEIEVKSSRDKGEWGGAGNGRGGIVWEGGEEVAERGGVAWVSSSGLQAPVDAHPPIVRFDRISAAFGEYRRNHNGGEERRRALEALGALGRPDPPNAWESKTLCPIPHQTDHKNNCQIHISESVLSCN